LHAVKLRLPRRQGVAKRVLSRLVDMWWRHVL